MTTGIAELNYEDLDAGERTILDLVNDERTVEEIRLETHSSDFHVCRILFRQWQEGRVKVVRPRFRGASGVSGPVTAIASTAAPASSGPITAGALVEAAQRHMGQQSYEAALRHLRAARSLEPDSNEIQEMLLQSEKSIRDAIEGSGVTLTSIPQLAVTFEQLTSSKLSPQEGFLLTRVNGSYDIQSLLKITPMPQLDALLVFWKLSQEGFIKMKAGKRK